MVKRLLSKTSVRVALIALIIIIAISGKTLLDRLITLQLLNQVASGSLHEEVPGLVRLPWYSSWDSVAGVAYVTRVTETKGVVVLLPQSAGGETRFNGMMAADKPLPSSILSPCSGAAGGSDADLCASLTGPTEPSTASTPGPIVVIAGKVGNGLYTVVNNAD